MFPIVDLPDLGEIHRLSRAIPKLLRPSHKSNGNKKYTVGFTLGTSQMVLLEDGNPILGFIPKGKDGAAILQSGVDFFVDEGNATSDRNEENQHMVMLYDNAKLARLVEFQYIRIGLEKTSQQGIYCFSADDSETQESVTRQMERYGIDTAKHMAEGTLKFAKFEDPAKHPEGYVAGARKNIEILSEYITKPPVRVVAHQRYLFNTPEEMQGQCDMERFVEYEFGTFPGSLLCNLYVERYGARVHKQWVKNVLMHHDVALLSFSNGSPGESSTFDAL